MHYCILVLTKEFPADDVLESALKPFYEDDYYKKQEEDPNTPRPVFKWDFWKLGGRYCAKLKIDVSGDNFEKYELKFYVKEKRSKRLFRAVLLEKVNLDADVAALFTPRDYSEVDALCYMGLRDNVIYADSARIEDCVSIPDGYGIVLPTGEAYARATWDGESWNKNTCFDEQREKAISENKDCWISVVDIHD